MSSTNVLSSAPDYEPEPSCFNTGQQLYPINEITQINAEDFRLKKISDLLTELSNEADHYRQVAKKYKRTHSVYLIYTSRLWSWVTFCWTVIRSPGNGLDWFGVVASLALAGVATVFGLSSVGLTAVSKRLERKVTKHEKIYTLALAKHKSVSELVSKALTDKRISDAEFTIIISEVQKYHELKAGIRVGEKKTKTENKEVQTPDLNKLKGELRKEIKEEFQKKINLLTAVSKSDLRY